MCAQVALSGECLRGKGPPNWMLTKSWRCLLLAACTLWANLVVAAVLRDSLYVVSLLPCMSDCCMLYTVCKVERFVLTKIIIIIIIIIVLCKSLCCQLLVNDKMLFTDDNFELMPVEGDIWPGNTAVVTVVFRPTEPKHYQQVYNHFTSAFIVKSLSQEQNVVVEGHHQQVWSVGMTVQHG